MLTVKPIQSKGEQAHISSLCGAVYDENAFAYRADENDGLIGICQFYFSDGVGYIKSLSYADGRDDSEAMIIMLRAAMNFMFRCGIEKSILCNGATTTELEKLSGYRKNENGQLCIDLKLFFDSPCKYQNKQ